MVSHGRHPKLEQDKDSSLWAGAETTHDELATTPFPSPCDTGEGRAGMGERVGEGVFKVLFYFSLSSSNFVSNKLNYYL